MLKLYCLAHADCADGTMAACLVQQFYRESYEVEVIFVRYNEPPPTLPPNARVVIVDFSYETETMKQLIRQAGTAGVTLLDHHPRTEVIKDEVDQWLNTDPEGLQYRASSHLYYDGSASGALIVWQWLHSPNPPPALIQYVSDRDLYQFKLPDTKAAMAGLFTYPMTLEAWGVLLRQPNAVAQCLMAAPTALRIQEIRIQWTIDNTMRMIEPTVDNCLVPAGVSTPFPLVNCAHDLVSETCGRLAKEHGMAMAYWDTAEERKFSIRSAEKDIRGIARYFPGGDGHAKAAGFYVPRSHPLAQL